MAPLRRYIRLAPHTTLQSLIFLEDPSLMHTWLLHPTNPALPRIVNSLKDLILPKLREERERERKAAASGSSSSAKKFRAVKDVVVGPDFEVSVFFKDGATRHMVLSTNREFVAPKREVGGGAGGGIALRNSGKMGLGNDAMDIADVDGDDGGGVGDDGTDGDLGNLRIENEDEDMDLNALPLADPATLDGVGMGEIEDASSISVPVSRSRRKTRTRGKTVSDDEGDHAYVPSGDEDPDRAEPQATIPSSNRRDPASKGNKASKSGSSGPTKGKRKQKEPITIDSDSNSEPEIERGVAQASGNRSEDRKKPQFKTSYEAYTIYGKVLYLIVKKLDAPPPILQARQAEARGETEATATTRAEEVPNTVVTRDIPIVPDLENTGITENGVMDSWMYMSQAVREEPD
ncbi:hypothetical protein ABW19_dt0209172 [Dactylella cylindrospora]|nr:hypothetical protein ABW19_dt0209172 [Dactylella cylindrospora]